MTEKQKLAVAELRLSLLRHNYPPIFGVDNETLEAASEAIREDLQAQGLEPLLCCGEHGLYFKGCQLVLVAK